MPSRRSLNTAVQVWDMSHAQGCMAAKTPRDLLTLHQQPSQSRVRWCHPSSCTLLTLGCTQKALDGIVANDSTVQNRSQTWGGLHCCLRARWLQEHQPSCSITVLQCFEASPVMCFQRHGHGGRNGFAWVSKRSEQGVNMDTSNLLLWAPSGQDFSMLECTLGNREILRFEVCPSRRRTGGNSHAHCTTSRTDQQGSLEWQE